MNTIFNCFSTALLGRSSVYFRNHCHARMTAAMRRPFLPGLAITASKPEGGTARYEQDTVVKEQSFK